MVSWRAGRSVEWDGKQVINDPAAAKLLKRPYRAPWVHPDPASV